MTNIKPCPACGREYARLLGASLAWQCCNIDCVLTGPCEDSDGTKWNSLPRRTPGTIEVPVAEVEALRDTRESYCAATRRSTSDQQRDEDRVAEALGRYNDSLERIIARLPPPAPDHVAVLREMAFAEAAVFGDNVKKAALRAAIEALEAKK